MKQVSELTSVCLSVLVRFGHESVWKRDVYDALIQQMAVARRSVLTLDVMLKQ